MRIAAIGARVHPVEAIELSTGRRRRS